MTSQRLTHTATAALCAALLAGCASGPAYERPAVDMPAAFSELPGWTLARPDPAGPKGDWWLDFHDPLLDELEPQAAVSNQNVRAAYANYQKATAAIQAARAALFPTLGINASASRQRAAAGGVSTGPTTSKSAAAAVSWSPDLWGQVRDSVQQSQALAQVSAATLANATLSAQIALATAVVELRVADENA
ncbi:MAG: TolC family protein, partial [Comamonas sp.]|nr:TolC family protein [Comamonas sp.]